MSLQGGYVYAAPIDVSQWREPQRLQIKPVVWPWPQPLQHAQDLAEVIETLDGGCESDALFRDLVMRMVRKELRK